jgi:hypothetical protein
VHGDPELVALLITHGATCAIYTASTGKLDMLKRLVEPSADLVKETTGIDTVLDSALTLAVLKYLRSVVVAAA